LPAESNNRPEYQAPWCLDHQDLPGLALNLKKSRSSGVVLGELQHAVEVNGRLARFAAARVSLPAQRSL
jgi:hypothetical protein